MTGKDSDKQLNQVHHYQQRAAIFDKQFRIGSHRAFGSSYMCILRLGGLYRFRKEAKQVKPQVGDLNQGCKGLLCDPP